MKSCLLAHNSNRTWHLSSKVYSTLGSYFTRSNSVLPPQDLRSELDSHEENLSALREACPILVAHCSPSDKLLVQNELAQISKQWDEFEKAWKRREVELEEVEDTSKQYNNTYELLLAWLTDMEQKLAEQPAVGTELDVVKEQLQQQKVRHTTKLRLLLSW